MTDAKSILSDVYQLADTWLELSFEAKHKPLYQHRTAALSLKDRATIPSSKHFLLATYKQIDNNWNDAVKAGSYSPSRENWRFKPRPDISPKNTSPEVRLERAIVSVANNHWANQIPTSSGLVGPQSDKVRNIDLVYRDDNQNFTLIELKVKSNTPLFAAIEILTYGLLFAWSRNNADHLSYDSSVQPLLAAKSINLCVLAPKEYYKDFKLKKLGESINLGLSEAKGIFGIPYTFEFTQFPKPLKSDDSPEQLLENAEQREAIFSAA